MKLLTLSKRVEKSDARMGVVNLEGTYDLKVMAYNELAIITNYNTLLSKPLTLSMLVPCKDGVPLSKPKNYDFYTNLEPNLTFSSDLSRRDMAKWTTECKEYQAAENLVIFEGWEIMESHNDGLDHILTNKELKLIYFSSENWTRKYFKVDQPYKDRDFKLKTISDLANATADNPLTLRQ